MIRAIAATLCLTLLLGCLPADAVAALARLEAPAPAAVPSLEAPLPALPPALEPSAVLAAPSAANPPVSLSAEGAPSAAQPAAAQEPRAAEAASAEQTRRFDGAGATPAAEPAFREAVSGAGVAPALGAASALPARAALTPTAPPPAPVPARRGGLRRLATIVGLSYGITFALSYSGAGVIALAGTPLGPAAVLAAGGAAVVAAIWPTATSNVRAIASMAGLTLVLLGFSVPAWAAASFAGILGAPILQRLYDQRSARLAAAEADRLARQEEQRARLDELKPLSSLADEGAGPSDDAELLARTRDFAAGARAFAERARAGEISAAAARLEAALAERRGEDAAVERARLKALLEAKPAGGAAAWSPAGWQLSRWSARYRRVALPVILTAAAVFGVGAAAVAWPAVFLPYYETFRMLTIVGILGMFAASKGSLPLKLAGLVTLAGASGFTALNPLLGPAWLGWAVVLEVVALLVVGKAWGPAAQGDRLHPMASDFLNGAVTAARPDGEARRRSLELLEGTHEERLAALRAVAGDAALARRMRTILSGLLNGRPHLPADVEEAAVEALAAGRDAEAAAALRSHGSQSALRHAEALERQLATLGELANVEAAARSPAATDATQALLARALRAAAALRGQGFAAQVRAEELESAAELVRDAAAQGRAESAALARSRLQSLLDGDAPGGAGLWSPEAREELAWFVGRWGRRAMHYVKPMLLAGLPLLGFGGLVYWAHAAFEPYAMMLAAAMGVGVISLFAFKGRRGLFFDGMLALAGASGFVAADPRIHGVWPLIAGAIMLLVYYKLIEGRSQSDPVLFGTRMNVIHGAKSLPARLRRLQLELGGTIEERRAALTAIARDAEASRALQQPINTLLWDTKLPDLDRDLAFDAVAAARDAGAVAILRSQGYPRGVALADELQRELDALSHLESVQDVAVAAKSARAADPFAELLARAAAATTALRAQGFAGRVRADEIEAAAAALKQPDSNEAAALSASRLQALLADPNAGGAGAWSIGGAADDLPWRLRRAWRHPGVRALLAVSAATLAAALAPFVAGPAAAAWAAGAGAVAVASSVIISFGLNALGRTDSLFWSVTVLVLFGGGLTAIAAAALPAAGLFAAVLFSGLAWALGSSIGGAISAEAAARLRGLSTASSRDERRLIEQIAGVRDERRAALRRIAGDMALARSLGPFLRGALSGDRLIPDEDEEAALLAVAAAGDAYALETLRGRARTRASELAAGLEAALATDAVAQAAAETGSAPPPELLDLASAAARRARSQGFAGRLRAEEIEASVETLRSASAEGRGDDAAVESVRLRALIGDAPTGGAGAWSPAATWKRWKGRHPFWAGLLILAAPMFTAAFLGHLFAAQVWAVKDFLVLIGVGGFWLHFGFGRETPAGRRAGYIGFLAWTAGLSASPVAPGAWTILPFLTTILVAAFGGATIPASALRRGLSRRERTQIRELLREGLPADEQRLAFDLFGPPEARREAIARISGDTALARRLSGILRYALNHSGTPPGERSDLIPAVAAARDADAIEALQISGVPGSFEAARRVREEIASSAHLEGLLEEAAKEAAAPAEDPLLEQAAAAAELSRAQGFAGRTRAEELERAADALRKAREARRDEDAALAASRLKALLDAAPAGGAAAWTPREIGAELAWRARRVLRHPALRWVGPVAAGMSIAYYYGSVVAFGFAWPWLAFPLVTLAGLLGLMAYGFALMRGRRVPIHPPTLVALGGVVFSGFEAILAGIMPTIAFWAIPVVALLGYGFVADRAGDLGPNRRKHLKAQATSLPREVQRLAAEIGGTSAERRDALKRLAGEPRLARGLGPLLRNILDFSDFVPPADLDATLEAVAAGRDEYALQTLRANSQPLARRLADELELELRAVRETAAMAEVEEAAAPAADLEALLARAYKKAGEERSRGFAGAVRADEIHAAAEAVRRSTDAQDWPTALLAGSRLRALLEDGPSPGAAAWAPLEAAREGAWLLRRLLRHPAAKQVVPFGLVMAAATTGAWLLPPGLFGSAVLLGFGAWLLAVVLAGPFVVRRLLREQTPSGWQPLLTAGVIVLDAQLAGLSLAFAYLFGAGVLVIAWAVASNGTGELLPDQQRLLEGAAAGLPRARQRAIIELGGPSVERRAALQRIAGDRELARALGPALRSVLRTPRLLPEDDRGLAIQAVWGARDDFALETLREQRSPAARRILGEAEEARALPEGLRRLRLDLVATPAERQAALAAIARDEETARLLLEPVSRQLEAMPTLLDLLCKKIWQPVEEKRLALAAIFAARNDEAAQVLRAKGYDAHAEELERQLAALKDLQALKAAADTPATPHEALLQSARQAAGALRGEGFSGRLRAEELEKAAADLAAALSAAREDDALVAAQRLSSLLRQTRASAPAAASPRGSGAVRLWKTLAHAGGAAAVSWPAVASWLLLPALGCALVTAALAVYLIPLWAVRPTPAAQEPAVVRAPSAAAPARELMDELVARAGLPPEAAPRVGVLADPHAYLAAREAGLDEASARLAETHNAKAFGGGLGHEGAIGVGPGLLREDRDTLEAALGHELGHLVHGDPHAYWAWAQRWEAPSRNVALAGAAGALGAWLFLSASAAPLLALGALGVGGWLLARWAASRAARAMERRADAFGAAMVGREKYAAFMGKLESWGAGKAGIYDAPAERAARAAAEGR